MSLGTTPAYVPCPFLAPRLHNLHKAGLDPGADLLLAASDVPRCAHMPVLARTPMPAHVHAHARTTLLFSLLGLGSSRGDSGIAPLSTVRFFVTLVPNSLPSGTRGTCTGRLRYSGSDPLAPESLGFAVDTRSMVMGTSKHGFKGSPEAALTPCCAAVLADGHPPSGAGLEGVACNRNETGPPALLLFGG